MAAHLAAVPEVALDTEGDSLHHYPERLALLQLADPGGTVWLVDPLAIGHLDPLRPLFAAPAPVVVVHAGDNDLAQLKRRHGLRFAAVFDTAIAARFLGVPALGLEALLGRYLGVGLPPSHQKDDWSARPLSAAQVAYAAADVAHLLALRARLTAELRRVGRLGWVEEECAALAAQEAPERAPDPEAFARLRGARDLSPRGLALLRELHGLREALALAADRPPFKILSDDTLVHLARLAPRDRAELGRVPGCTPRVIERRGDAILEAVSRALALPESALPRLEAPPRQPPLPAGARRRIERLRQWRAEAAARLGLDPGLVLPNRLVVAVARAAPRDPEALGRVDGVRRWRVRAFGDEILAALAGA